MSVCRPHIYRRHRRLSQAQPAAPQATTQSSHRQPHPQCTCLWGVGANNTGFNSVHITYILIMSIRLSTIMYKKCHSLLPINPCNVREVPVISLDITRPWPNDCTWYPREIKITEACGSSWNDLISTSFRFDWIWSGAVSSIIKSMTRKVW